MKNDQNKAIVHALLVVGFVWTVNGVFMSWLSRLNVMVFWAADFLQWVLTPALLIYWLVTRYNLSFRKFGFSKHELTLGAFGFAAVAALTFYPAFFWVRNFIWQQVGQVGPIFVLKAAFPTGLSGIAFRLYSAVTAGIVESIFFLGLPWLLWTRCKVGNKVLFTLLVSTVFAVVHWEQGLHVLVGAFVFSIVSCVWYLQLKNLWPIAIGHIVVDLIAFA